MNGILIYLLGSFIAFLIVVRHYSKDYYTNPSMKDISRDHPEACIVFWAAAFLSWIFVIGVVCVNSYRFIKSKL